MAFRHSGKKYVERGLLIGERTEYVDGLVAELERVLTMKFKFALNYQNVLTEYYTYQPVLVVYMFADSPVEILQRLSQDTNMNRSVFAVIVPKRDGIIGSVPTDAHVDVIVESSGDYESDALKIISGITGNLRFGLNLYSASRRVPIVTEFNWHDPSRDSNYFESNISDVLSSLGIAKGLNGHKYLIAAIAIQSAARDIPKPRVLYECVAEYYNTTPWAVEKAIRYAIERAWVEGDINFQHAVFGFSIDASRGKPTNAELISRMAVEFFPPRI